MKTAYAPIASPGIGGRRRLAAGDVVEPFELTTIRGERMRVPAEAGLVHLQFRRYAGCPICNVHLRSVARRHDELSAAGIVEIAVFHSSAESMRPHQSELPFAAIADPAKALYARFGVESSARAVLHPLAWIAPLKPRSCRSYCTGCARVARPRRRRARARSVYRPTY